MQPKSSLLNVRLLTVLFLGFSSGLPLALTGSTLQAWFTVSNVDIVTIGTLSLIGFPYVWKFLWAPFLDRFVPPFWGKRRGWIFITQLGLCLSILWLAKLNPASGAKLIGLIGLLIAFLSSTQDIAIDAYRTDVLRAEERGLGSAYFIFGYRMAMLVSGGLALVLVDYFGWRIMYEVMATLMAVSIMTTYLAPIDHETPDHTKNIWQTIKNSFSDLWSRESIIIILLFIIFYKLGDAFALSLLTNFLIHGLGFSLTQIGVAYKSVSIVATILGALLGGTLLVRLDLYRGLLLFGLGQAISTLLFMILAVVGKNYLLAIAVIFVENFCSGMSTAAFLAFIMTVCDHRFSATQFACLSALSAVGRVVVGPFAGLFVEHFGWVTFFGSSFLLAFPGLILLALLPQRIQPNAEVLEC